MTPRPQIAKRKQVSLRTVEREMLRGARKLRAGLRPNGHGLPPELRARLEQLAQRLDN